MTAPDDELRAPLVFTYRNYRGEIAMRCAVPKSVWYGETSYHRKPQWFLRAYDIDKDAERDFAMGDILTIGGPL